MLLTIVYNYKTEKQPYVNGFVHSRVLSYIENGMDARVFVLNRKKEKVKYIFDGVQVYVGYIDELVYFIINNKIKDICIHFLDFHMIKALNKMPYKLNLFIFVHGAEALMWYERLFPYMFSDLNSVITFLKYIINNSLDMFFIRKFLRNTTHGFTLIAVSNWMKAIAIKNWRCSDDNWVIIPNIVNSKLFSFEEKNTSQKFKLLTIRPFFTGKYANDITVNVIKKLSKYKEFQKMKIMIIGDGRLFDELTNALVSFKNVTRQKRFLQQHEIADYHKQYGIFICPTRQDAQGVSMCEAMSSGLIPITSNNTAILEYLPPNCGLACNNEDEMVKRILTIMGNDELFQTLSKEVSRFVQDKCSYEKTVKKELDLIKNSIKERSD